METVDIKDYINLYRRALSLDKIMPLKNQTYKLFRACKSAGVKIASRSQVYDNATAFSKIKYFVKDNEYFYMIPVTTVSNTIVGFILRGVTRSDYSTISRTFSDREYQLPLMYGFSPKFKNLDVLFEKYKKAVPIIICEGSKDCMSLKKIYPYVLANNTSSMGLNAHVLLNLTNKFILAYDNDQAGVEGMEKDKKFLRSRGAFVDTIKIPYGFKDCTDCIFNKKASEYLKKQVKRSVKDLFSLD